MVLPKTPNPKTTASTALSTPPEKTQTERTPEMSVTLIASSTQDLPGAPIDQCGVGDWLRSITVVQDWVADREQRGEAVHVLAGDRPLPHHLAEDSLTVPTSPSVDRRLRDEIDVEET